MNPRLKTAVVIVIAIMVSSAAVWCWYLSHLVGERRAASREFRNILSSLLVRADYKRPLENVFINNEGRPLYSWRFDLLPFVDPIPVSSSLPDGFTERWDDKGQQAISQAGYGRGLRAKNSPAATVFAFEGEDCAFLPQQSSVADVYSKWKPLNEKPGQLILILQARQTQIEWNQPGDCRVADLELLPDSATLGNTPVFGGAILVGFCDGQVWLLSPNTPIRLLLKFATIKIAMNAEREKELGGYALERF